MNYRGTKKSGDRIDKMLGAVSFNNVPQVYAQCDIILKNSILESFSYPLLEMMATGGYVVAARNGGNAEFLKHRVNSLLFNSGEFDKAVSYIEEIVEDEELCNTLFENGLATAKSRDWSLIGDDIYNLYQ